MVLLTALLAGLAVLLLVPPSGASRLARAVGAGAVGAGAVGAGAVGIGAVGAGAVGAGAVGAGAVGRARAGRGAGSRARTGSRGVPPPVLACGLAGAALALLVPLPVGLAAGAAVAVVGPRVLGRLEPRAVRNARERLLADLPLLLDLLSSCLAGGAALPEAARAVAAAVPGPAGARLGSVAAMLAVGAPPQEAWGALSAGRQDDPLAPAARALARAADGGAPVAAAVARLAAEARAEARSAAEQAARRVGVLVVAPLGLCFLPAFVLLGVVPVVAGLAGPLLAGT